MVSIQLPVRQGQTETLIITDPDGRTLRELNKALEMGPLAAQPLAKKPHTRVGGGDYAGVDRDRSGWVRGLFFRGLEWVISR